MRAFDRVLADRPMYRIPFESARMRAIGPSSTPVKNTPRPFLLGTMRLAPMPNQKNRYLHAHSLSTDGRPNLKWPIWMPEKHQMQLYFSRSRGITMNQTPLSSSPSSGLGQNSWCSGSD